MRILYVEDNPFDADLTRRALQRSAPQLSLEVARSQKEALERLQTGAAYDLLLTDLRLPDGNGFSLLSHVRENKLHLAVVVITGQGDEEIAVSALKAGANDYLVKRENYLVHLWGTLENALERYRMEEARRERPLRILCLDNHPNDIELTLRHFTNHAPHIHLEMVHTAREMFQRLPGGGQPAVYDVLMIDYHQQDLSALDLLKELRQVRGIGVPIVLVTARGDEALAAQALRLGASDYVVKSPGYLFGLPGLIENAYHRAQLQREQAALLASEERFRRLAENAPDIIYRLRLHPELSIEYISPAVESLTGLNPEALTKSIVPFLKAVHPEDVGTLQQLYSDEVYNPAPMAFRLYRTDGRLIWLEGRNVAIRDGTGNIIAHEGILRDITERKHSEEHIQRQLERLNALRMIDSSITGNLGLQNTLNELIKHVLLQLSADAAGILLYDTLSSTLDYSASQGFGSDAILRRYGPNDRGLAGRAIQSRQTIHISNPQEVREDPVLAALWQAEGIISYYGAPLIANGEVLGVLEVYHRTLVNPDGEWLNFLETLAGQAAIAINNAKLLESLQQANQDLTLTYDITLEAWVSLLHLRDKETEDHTRRVTDMTVRLAQAMGMDEEALVHIKRGALLHDIGKVGIPDSILNKNGPLDDAERTEMRQHPCYAFQFLSSIEYLKDALAIPYYHHERWDGTGYPQGLKGEAIPLEARIFAVVDVWDALSSDRVYRKAWDQEQVLDHLRMRSGSHFDPQVVDKFLELLTQNS